MKIIDTTNTPTHRKLLEKTWKSVPKHWQKAMDNAVSQGTEIVDSSRFMQRVEAPDMTWIYHPINHPLKNLTSTGLEDMMALLRKTDQGYQVCCSWRFKVNFVSPKFYFRKHFLRTLAIAVYLERDDLRKIVSEQIEMKKDSVEAELFFGDTFYKWCMYDRSDSHNQERYGGALARLDRINEQAMVIL